MIRGKFRVILYFDLAMVPHPSDAPAIPLGACPSSRGIFGTNVIPFEA